MIFLAAYPTLSPWAAYLLWWYTSWTRRTRHIPGTYGFNSDNSDIGFLPERGFLVRSIPRHSLLSPKRSPRDLVILLEHPISEFSIHTQRTIGVICSIVLIACELLTTSELFLRFLDSRHSRLFLKRLPRDLIVARLTVLLMWHVIASTALRLSLMSV